MKKNLLLSCLLAFSAVFGVQANDAWPIVLTTTNGLPGSRVITPTTTVLQYTSSVFKFADAVTTVRLTVASTNTVDALNSTYDGMSGGWGVAFPFFTMSELRVFDANGVAVEFTVTSNGPSMDSAEKLEFINDGLNNTYFASVSASAGYCPQAYHYIDIELPRAMSSFKLQWDTRNANNCPTYVGLTPGTLFLPYPEMGMVKGEQATTVADLAQDGGLFLIKGNIESFTYNDTRTFEGSGYFHSPAGAAVEPSAADLVYLIPTGEENTYKVRWLTNNHYMGQCAGAAWLPWTLDENLAGKITFLPCDSVEGDFVMKMAGYKDADNKEYVIAQDGIVKMRTVVEGTKPNAGARPFNAHFTIYKATVGGSTVKSSLQAVIIEAESRISAYGQMPDDVGEFVSLTDKLNNAKSIYSSSSATSQDVLGAVTEVQKATADYAALKLYVYADSIEQLMDDDSFEYSNAPNWVIGTRPLDLKYALEKASLLAFTAAEDYTCLADVDIAIEAVTFVISNFWTLRVDSPAALPVRFTTASGLPGTKLASGSWDWTSPVVLLSQPTSVLRLTVFVTNNNAKFRELPFPTLGEFMLYDAAGSPIPLTAANFTTNSLCTTDGGGLAALCDGNPATFYHGAYDEAHTTLPDNFVYLEVTLDQPINGFQYRQIGRANGNNAPTDITFSVDAVAAAEDVVVYNPNTAELGTKITNLSQITDDGIYALAGLLDCDPIHGTAGSNPNYYQSITVASIGKNSGFVFEDAGEGTYYVRSIYDNKYWGEVTSWASGTSVYYKDQAAKLHIVPSNNSGLPNAFKMYIDGPDTEKPNCVYQDWGGGLGVFPVAADFGNDDKDGQSEWYIYHITMNDPYKFWLLNAVKSINELGLAVSTDPGCYPNLGNLPTHLQAAQAVINSGDFSNAKSVLQALNSELDVLANAEKNPVIDGGIYVIESGYAEFFNKQGLNKAIFVDVNNNANDGVTTTYKPYWGNLSSIEDSLYWFRLTSPEDRTEVDEWLATGKITEFEASNAFSVQHVKTNAYIGEMAETSKAVPTSDVPVTYIIRFYGSGLINVWNPKGASFALHGNNHDSGAGVSSNIVYYGSGVGGSTSWRLRSVSTTGINDIPNGSQGDYVVNTTYYTIGGFMSNVPVKNIVNIKKTTYANGVVETKKIYIK